MQSGLAVDWELGEGWGCPKETDVTPRGNLHKIRSLKETSHFHFT